MTQLMFEHMQATAKSLNVRHQIRMEDMQREALRLNAQIVEMDRAAKSQQLTNRQILAAYALAGISGHLNGAKKRDNETAAQGDARWCLERADAVLARSQGITAHD